MNAAVTVHQNIASLSKGMVIFKYNIFCTTLIESNMVEACLEFSPRILLGKKVFNCYFYPC